MDQSFSTVHQASVGEQGARPCSAEHGCQSGTGEHTHLPDSEQPPLQPGPTELQNQTQLEDESSSIPECPICYMPYDNVFKTPLLLCCSHTFCLECLATMCLFLKQLQKFHCPVCRAEQVIPQGGIPKLPANVDFLAQRGSGTLVPQEVWMDGHQLCSVRKESSAQGQASRTLVTVQLLSNPSPQEDDAGELIGVGHTTQVYWCRASYKAVCTMVVLILSLLTLLFTVILVPLYLKQ